MLQGQAAERLAGPTAGWVNPRALRFHTSTHFDLMEGRFDGRYYSEPPISDRTIKNMVADYGLDAMAEVVAYNTRVKNAPARELRAVHQRQVVLLRQSKFWIVIDQVDGGASFTQTWHFPPPSEGLNAKNYLCPGFGPEQVRFDEPTKRVVTIRHDRSNIAILNFHNAAVRYGQHFGDKFPFRGWYSFGIGGERVPAVTMEATWSGSAPMVTVLLPSKARPDAAKTLDYGLTGFAPLNTETISGFAYTEKAAMVRFQASRVVQPLAAGTLTAEAKSLLCREEADGVVTGLVLDCKSLSVAGRAQTVSTPDFEFRVAKGALSIVAPVKVPQGFKWKADPQGRLAPGYE